MLKIRYFLITLKCVAIHLFLMRKSEDCVKVPGKEYLYQLRKKKKKNLLLFDPVPVLLTDT